MTLSSTMTVPKPGVDAQETPRMLVSAAAFPANGSMDLKEKGPVEAGLSVISPMLVRFEVDNGLASLGKIKKDSWTDLNSGLNQPSPSDAIVLAD
jgi:hypothetical protein